MATVAQLQAELDALKEAWRSGATSIGYEGKNISYVSTQEMATRIAAIESELGVTSSAPRTIVVRSSKGW